MADITLQTVANWHKDKPELIKLIKIGLAAEEFLQNTRDYFDKQKELLNVEDLENSLEDFKTKKTDLAKRLNTTPSTLQNWKTTKPELIRIIDLALFSEQHLKETLRYLSASENRV